MNCIQVFTDEQIKNGILKNLKTPPPLISEEVKAKVKALFFEDVEGIYISKNDYDRLYGDLTLENIELKQEIERLNNKLLRIRKLISRTPRQTSKEKAYIMLKCEIAKVIGSDKE